MALECALSLPVVLGALVAAMAAAGEPVMRNVVESAGAYTLASGPRVEGVALLHQGRWPADVINAFHNTPWLDAASIRLPWADLEPRDQEFNWAPFDEVLSEVKRYNETHPAASRTVHIRVMAGEHCPVWFEQAGVRFYDTAFAPQPGRSRPLRVPMPYDNPEFLKQLREVYRAMYERYKAEPLVTVYHGTWSAGPWDEIFHPQGREPLPPDYTPEKFVAGMTQQLDVLIEEFCLKGKVAELPYSGLYPQKSALDITGPLTARIVERLGRRSPFVYIQSNGWGMTTRGEQTVSWGHERDINDAFGQVNLAFQALGTNAGGGWWPQGDWVGLIEMAERYDAAYVEIYPPDLAPLDTAHRIVEAFTQPPAPAGTAEPGAVGSFIAFRPWLARRARVLYVREGTVSATFRTGGEPERMDRIMKAAASPGGTRMSCRARTRVGDGPWSEWQDEEDAPDLPPGTEAQLEATLHTDDGYLTPRLIMMRPAWQSAATSENPY